MCRVSLRLSGARDCALIYSTYVKRSVEILFYALNLIIAKRCDLDRVFQSD